MKVSRPNIVPYFRVPKEIFSIEGTPSQKLVLLALFRLGLSFQPANDFVSVRVEHTQAGIAKITGLTVGTVRSAIKFYEARGILRIERPVRVQAMTMVICAGSAKGTRIGGAV